MEGINSVIKNAPENKENLLKSYTEIEEIEKDVIYPINISETNGNPDINKINESIIILNNRNAFQKPD